MSNVKVVRGKDSAVVVKSKDDVKPPGDQTIWLQKEVDRLRGEVDAAKNEVVKARDEAVRAQRALQSFQDSLPEQVEKLAQESLVLRQQIADVAPIETKGLSPRDMKINACVHCGSDKELLLKASDAYVDGHFAAIHAARKAQAAENGTKETKAEETLATAPVTAKLPVADAATDPQSDYLSALSSYFYKR